MNATRTIPLALLLIVATLAYLFRPAPSPLDPPAPPPAPRSTPAPPPSKPASPFVLRHGEKHYGGARCPACEFKEIVF